MTSNQSVLSPLQQPFDLTFTCRHSPAKMYFDPKRNAYIDTESGAVVLQEEDGYELTEIYHTENITPRTEPSTSRTERGSGLTATIARPASSSSYYTPLSKQRNLVAPSPEESVASLEQQLYDIHVSGADAVEPTVTGPADHSLWDDWTMARTLQALEFEIPNEMFEGGECLTAHARAFAFNLCHLKQCYSLWNILAEEGDFNRKEYHASRSCRRQMLTISSFIVLVQVQIVDLSLYAVCSDRTERLLIKANSLCTVVHR